jgi:hypothetical protein
MRTAFTLAFSTRYSALFSKGTVVRLFYRITAYLLLIGVIHTALTPLFYDRLSVEALWFAGTGFALVFLSLLNIAAEHIFEPWILNLSIAANLAGCIYSILIVIVLPEVQAYVGLAIFLAVTVTSIIARSKCGFAGQTAH